MKNESARLGFFVQKCNRWESKKPPTDEINHGLLLKQHKSRPMFHSIHFDTKLHLLAVANDIVKFDTVRGPGPLSLEAYNLHAVSMCMHVQVHVRACG
jgi:hypothetical protein